MYEFRVGELYSPNRTRWPEGIEYNFRSGVHEMRIFFENLTAREKRAITQQPFDLAVAGVGDVIFMLTRFYYDHIWNDSPYTIHLVSADEQKPPPPVEADQGLALTIFLVEATTGILEGIRVVGMPPAFVHTLHQLIEQQVQRAFDPAEYDKQLAEIYQKYPSASDLAGIAQARARFNRSRE